MKIDQSTILEITGKHGIETILGDSFAQNIELSSDFNDLNERSLMASAVKLAVNAKYTLKKKKNQGIFSRDIAKQSRLIELVGG